MARNRSTRTTTGKVLLCGVIFGAASARAEAAKLDYQLEADLVRSDNIARTEFNRRSENVLVPRLRFDFSNEGPALTLRARGMAEYRYYTDDTFPDETRGELAAQLGWSVLPGRLALVLEDYLSEQPVDFRSADTPGNIQQVNVLVGGATLKAHLAPATEAQLDLRAADTHAEETTSFNSSRYGASFAVKRGTSPTSDVSIHLSATEVDFDQSIASNDYSRAEAFLQYEKRLRHGSLDLEAGRSRIDPKGPAPATSTALLRGTLAWRATARSEFRLRARRQFADSVQDLVLRQSDFDEPLVADLADPGVLITSSAYLQKYVDLQYRYRGDRFTVRIRPQYQQNRYLDDSADDRDIRSASARVDYRSRPRLTFFAQATYSHRDYVTDAREDRDREFSLGAEYRLTRHWSWRAQATRTERDSNITGASYTDNMARFSVSWKR